MPPRSRLDYCNLVKKRKLNPELEGQLIFVAAHLTEIDLAALQLVSTEDGILAFLRAALPGASGAVTGAAPAGRTESPWLTSFVQALLAAKLEPLGSGMALLSCGPGVFFPDDRRRQSGGTLLVRDFYSNLFKLLTDQPSWLLTGVPGTGKSWFTWFIIHALLTQPQPPAIVWQAAQRQGRCALFKDGKAFAGDISAFMPELHEPSTWYIADGMLPFSGEITARIGMICSPKRSVYKDWLKVSDVVQLTMPLWTWEEMEECWQQLYQDKLPLDRVRTNFHLWYGGVPRLVLERPSHQDASMDKRDALDAIKVTNIDQVIAACSGAYDAGPEASHRVVHQDGDRTTFQQAGYRFATSNVASLVMKRVSRSGSLAQLVQVLSASPDSDQDSRGLLFEPYAHMQLLGGGQFDCKYLDRAAGAAAQPSQLQLQVPDFEREVFFSPGSQSRAGANAPLITDIKSFCEEAQQLQQSGVQSAYLRASGQGHPLVDSCIYPDTLMQMTVSQSKPRVNEELLELHLACLPDRPEYFLDFVVSQDAYEHFTVPKLKRNDTLVRVQKTHVRVVKVVAAATSPRLPRSRAMLRPTVLPTRCGPMASRCRAVV